MTMVDEEVLRSLGAASGDAAAEIETEERRSQRVVMWVTRPVTQEPIAALFNAFRHSVDQVSWGQLINNATSGSIVYHEIDAAPAFLRRLRSWGIVMSDVTQVERFIERHPQLIGAIESGLPIIRDIFGDVPIRFELLDEGEVAAEKNLQVQILVGADADVGDTLGRVYELEERWIENLEIEQLDYLFFSTIYE